MSRSAGQHRLRAIFASSPLTSYTAAHRRPPAVALWLFRGFPAHRVPYYITAQILGGAAGAAVVYSNYFTSINLKEGGPARTVIGPHATAPLFVTFPQPYLSWASAAWSEALASAALVCVVFALSDKKNLSPPKGTMRELGCGLHSRLTRPARPAAPD